MNIWTQVKDIIAKWQAATTWQDKLALAVQIGELVLSLVKQVSAEPSPPPIKMMAANPDVDALAGLQKLCDEHGEAGMQALPIGVLISTLLPLLLKALQDLLKS